MADRKAELERKRERLRQVREEKERRKREREEADAMASAMRTATGEAGSASAHEQINKQLADMGITPVDHVLGTVASLPSNLGALGQVGETKGEWLTTLFDLDQNHQTPHLQQKPLATECR